MIIDSLGAADSGWWNKYSILNLLPSIVLWPANARVAGKVNLRRVGCSLATEALSLSLRRHSRPSQVLMIAVDLTTRGASALRLKPRYRRQLKRYCLVEIASWRTLLSPHVDVIPHKHFLSRQRWLDVPK